MNSILSEIFYDAGYLFIIIGTLIALIFGLGFASRASDRQQPEQRNAD